MCVFLSEFTIHVVSLAEAMCCSTNSVVINNFTVIQSSFSGYQSSIIGSKVKACLLKSLILPNVGIALGRVGVQAGFRKYRKFTIVDSK